MDPSHLKNEELNYELFIRFIDGISDKTAKMNALRNAFQKENQGLELNPVTNRGLKVAEEIEICYEKILELKGTCSQAIKNGDQKLLLYVRSRFLHLLGRSERIHTSSSSERNRVETLRNAVKKWLEAIDRQSTGRLVKFNSKESLYSKQSFTPTKEFFIGHGEDKSPGLETLQENNKRDEEEKVSEIGDKNVSIDNAQSSPKEASTVQNEKGKELIAENSQVGLHPSTYFPLASSVRDLSFPGKQLDLLGLPVDHKKGDQNLEHGRGGNSNDIFPQNHGAFRKMAEASVDLQRQHTSGKDLNGNSFQRESLPSAYLPPTGAVQNKYHSNQYFDLFSLNVGSKNRGESVDHSDDENKKEILKKNPGDHHKQIESPVRNYTQPQPKRTDVRYYQSYRQPSAYLSTRSERQTNSPLQVISDFSSLDLDPRLRDQDRRISHNVRPSTSAGGLAHHQNVRDNRAHEYRNREVLENPNIMMGLSRDPYYDSYRQKPPTSKTTFEERPNAAYEVTLDNRDMYLYPRRDEIEGRGNMMYDKSFIEPRINIGEGRVNTDGNYGNRGYRDDQYGNGKEQNNCVTRMNRKYKPVYAWPIKFDGDTGLSLTDFIDQVEMLAMAEGIDNRELLSSIIHLLTGRAFDWYRTNFREIRSWTDFKRQIREEFIPANYEHMLLWEIETRVQGRNEPFSTYLNAMKRLFQCIKLPLSEEYRLYVVRKGLNNTYAMSLASADIRSLAELSSMCKRIDSTKLMLDRQRCINVSRDTLLEPDISFPNANRSIRRQVNAVSHEEHYPNDNTDVEYDVAAIRRTERRENNAGERENTQVTAHRQSPYSNVICWNCENQGHIFNSCPTPRQGIFCFKCGMKGLVIRNCTRCNSETNRSQPNATLGTNNNIPENRQ